eukprot:ANDGO_05894.mRNA.1 hypothetical protein
MPVRVADGSIDIGQSRYALPLPSSTGSISVASNAQESASTASRAGFFVFFSPTRWFGWLKEHPRVSVTGLAVCGAAYIGYKSFQLFALIRLVRYYRRLYLPSLTGHSSRSSVGPSGSSSPLAGDSWDRQPPVRGASSYSSTFRFSTHFFPDVCSKLGVSEMRKATASGAAKEEAIGGGPAGDAELRSQKEELKRQFLVDMAKGILVHPRTQRVVVSASDALDAMAYERAELVNGIARISWEAAAPWRRWIAGWIGEGVSLTHSVKVGTTSAVLFVERLKDIGRHLDVLIEVVAEIKASRR